MVEEYVFVSFISTLSFEQCNHDAKEETAHRVLGPKTFLYKPYMDIN